MKNLPSSAYDRPVIDLVGIVARLPGQVQVKYKGCWYRYVACKTCRKKFWHRTRSLQPSGRWTARDVFCSGVCREICVTDLNRARQERWKRRKEEPPLRVVGAAPTAARINSTRNQLLTHAFELNAKNKPISSLCGRADPKDYDFAKAGTVDCKGCLSFMERHHITLRSYQSEPQDHCDAVGIPHELRGGAG